MRLLFWTFVLLSLALLGYCAWPLVGATQLAAAAQSGSTPGLMERVDLPALRRSLARQIVRAYMAQDDKLKNLNGIAQSLAGGVGTSMADAMLKDVLTPEGISAILKDGKFGGEKFHMAASAQLPQLVAVADNRGIGTVLNAYFDGPTSFVVPVGGKEGEGYGVHLQLAGTTWRLSGLDLPSSLVNRLSKEAVERQNKNG